MEPLVNQLRELPKTLSALPAAIKLALVVGILAVAGAAVYATVSGAEAYQYAFTNLTPEDSSEAASTLKTAGVPFVYRTHMFRLFRTPVHCAGGRAARTAAVARVGPGPGVRAAVRSDPRRAVPAG